MGLFDFLNPQKQHINALEADNERLYKKLHALEDSVKDTKAMELAEVESYIAERQQFKEQLEKQINELQAELLDIEPRLEMQQYSLYKPKYDFATSLQYKDKLTEIRNKQKEMIRDKTAVTYNYDWHVNGSKAEGRKMINGQIKVILRCFNSECEAAINKIKYNNFDSIKKKIQNSYDVLNKAFSTNQVGISNRFLKLKFEELQLGYEYERKKEDEREALREQRDKEREERALQKEIDNKKKKIDKELVHLQNLIDELNAKLAAASSAEEKTAIQAQIDEAQQAQSNYTDEQKELDYRLANVGAGYVYVISNVGAFGPDIFKIGVTRRLDPLERINELSSASVPFKFDVHALVFSYNAYQLEADLHKRFEANRVNKVNNRKEFFKIPMDELEAELNNYKDLTIEFIRTPDAEEYQESINMSKKPE